MFLYITKENYLHFFFNKSDGKEMSYTLFHLINNMDLHFNVFQFMGEIKERDNIYL